MIDYENSDIDTRNGLDALTSEARREIVARAKEAAHLCYADFGATDDAGHEWNSTAYACADFSGATQRAISEATDAAGHDIGWLVFDDALESELQRLLLLSPNT